MYNANREFSGSSRIRSHLFSCGLGCAYDPGRRAAESAGQGELPRPACRGAQGSARSSQCVLIRGAVLCPELRRMSKESMNAQPTTTTAETSASDPGPQTGQGGLQAGLKNRHLSMIAIGGVIGAGLFVGSGAGIAAAGPGILLSYALVGLHGRPRDADAGRDGRRRPDLRLLLRLRRPGARPLGGLLDRLALLVLLGRGARGRGDRRCRDPGGLDTGRPAVGLGADRDGGAHRAPTWSRSAPTASSSSGSRGSRSSRSPPSSSSACSRSSALLPGSDNAGAGLGQSDRRTAASCPTVRARSSPVCCWSSSPSWAARSSPWPPASPRTRSAPSPRPPTA